MRALTLTTSYPKSPGDSTAPFIRAISHGVADHGIAVDLVLPHHPELEWPDGDPPIELHEYRYWPGESRLWHVWGYAGALRADVDIRARTFGVLPFALATCLARSARLARRRAYDVVHAHWVLPNGLPGALVAGGRGLPLVVSLHGSGVSVAERNRAWRAVARTVFRRAAKVTACSDDLRDRAVALGASPEAAEVIPYGVDLDAFIPASETEKRIVRSSWNVPRNAFLIVAVGRLVEKKGFRYLIEAFPRVVETHPNARLVIAGSGDLLEELRQCANEMGVTSAVAFPGNLDRTAVVRLLRTADVLAVPSVRDQSGNVDGLPNVLLEGLASGLCVVATTAGGIPQAIEDGVDGRLVPQEAPDALAEVLVQLGSSPARRQELGREARRTAERKHAWDRIAGRYASVLKVASRGKP